MLYFYFARVVKIFGTKYKISWYSIIMMSFLITFCLLGYGTKKHVTITTIYLIHALDACLPLI